MNIFYYSIFIVRRFIFIGTAFILSDIVVIQIIVFILTNILYLSYLVYNKPLYEGLYVEIFNEITTLLLSHLMIVFTDSTYEWEIKNMTGHVFVGLFMANIIINILLITKDTISKVYKLIK